MIERLLEIWLNRANERSFQIPFCHALAADGYTVVHMSRHCAMELGKDILAIAPDGVTCVYQLKGVDGGGKIGIGKWREDLGQQIHALVHTAPYHPSLPRNGKHRSYIVLNGEIEEEVQAEIDRFNENNRRAGQNNRILNVIVKGELFRMFQKLQSDFWATNLNDLKTFLELVTEDGRGQLPREKLSKLFESAMPFWPREGRKVTTGECERSVAGAAVICASAIWSFTKSSNHAAEFEAWTMFWSYSNALVDRWPNQKINIQSILLVAEQAIFSSLSNLCEELIHKKGNYVEGSILEDFAVYRVRLTYILSLMSVYSLWRYLKIHKRSEQFNDDHDEFLSDFLSDRMKTFLLWGEFADPQFIAFTFYLKTFKTAIESDMFLYMILHNISSANLPSSNNSLPNPYYDAEAILPYTLGLEPKTIVDDFAGASYTLEGVLHLFVLENYRELTKDVFPRMTKIALKTFIPHKLWQFYFYRNHNRGLEYTPILQPPHRWQDLRKIASECKGEFIPRGLKKFPILFLCFLLVFPHRTTSNGLRWLAKQMKDLK